MYRNASWLCCSNNIKMVRDGRENKCCRVKKWCAIPLPPPPRPTVDLDPRPTLSADPSEIEGHKLVNVPLQSRPYRKIRNRNVVQSTQGG